MLKTIFLWIYRMDFHEVLILLVVCTGLFYTAYTKLHCFRFWKPVVISVLLLWAAAVVAQTILWRTPSNDPILSLQPFQSYFDALREGGQRELLRSNFMNVLLFYPAGLLLAAIFPWKRKPVLQFLVILMIAVTFSTVIEFVQFHYCLGQAQTDDVIHATFGAWIGAAVMCLLRLFCNKKTNHR